MKVLVIPDVHLRAWMFDRADDILKAGKAERAVCLMDIPDEWGMEMQIEKYRIVFDRAIQFAKEYPDTLWCYGNVGQDAAAFFRALAQSGIVE